MQNRKKVFPGIKDLPEHIHINIRNEFIRYIFKQTATLELAWANPEVDSLQVMYDIVYPTFPARIRPASAAFAGQR